MGEGEDEERYEEEKDDLPWRWTRSKVADPSSQLHEGRQRWGMFGGKGRRATGLNGGRAEGRGGGRRIYQAKSSTVLYA